MAGTTTDIISASCTVLSTMATSKWLLVLGVDGQGSSTSEPILDLHSPHPLLERALQFLLGDHSFSWGSFGWDGADLILYSLHARNGLLIEACQPEAQRLVNGWAFDPVWASEIRA